MRARLALLGALVACGGSGADDAPAAPAATTPTVVVHRVVAPASPAPDIASLYLDLEGRGTGDTLVTVELPAGGEASIHETRGGIMQPAGPVVVAAGQRVTFRPGGLHVMATSLPAPFARGDTITAVLVFAAAGRVEVRVPVFTYTEAVRLLDTAP